MNLSPIQAANFSSIAGLIVLVLNQFGIVFQQDQLVFILSALWTTGSTIYSFWTRYQAGDITLGGSFKDGHLGSRSL